MEFKIDTKENFSVITVDGPILNGILAEKLGVLCADSGQTGSRNLIIDLQHVTAIDSDALAQMLTLHQDVYAGDHSFVLTMLSDHLLAQLHDQELDLVFNIAPRMAEAIDIVSMEILERDLLSEE